MTADLDRMEAVARSGLDAPPDVVLALIAALREARAAFNGLCESLRDRNPNGKTIADFMNVWVGQARDRAERAEAEAAKLRAVFEAAKEWRAHTFGCSITQAVFTKPGRDSAWSKPCTCGFDQMAAALAALEPTPQTGKLAEEMGQ